ncbi:hypothetical protein CFBP5473_15440 [Agrobacterium larrymoorei]|uniref:Uncharacterized protein n=1 Tax=Agrobacterium larrymoorei TaxID=160699 RepID=A0A4D7E5E5_9HYPH|nr:hypothetical protein CFBP5473_15440 [Agrobacterium larrymoorei]
MSVAWNFAEKADTVAFRNRIDQLLDLFSHQPGMAVCWVDVVIVINSPSVEMQFSMSLKLCRAGKAR